MWAHLIPPATALANQWRWLRLLEQERHSSFSYLKVIQIQTLLNVKNVNTHSLHVLHSTLLHVADFHSALHSEATEVLPVPRIRTFDCTNISFAELLSGPSGHNKKAPKASKASKSTLWHNTKVSYSRNVWVFFVSQASLRLIQWFHNVPHSTHWKDRVCLALHRALLPQMPCHLPQMPCLLCASS